MCRALLLGIAVALCATVASADPIVGAILVGWGSPPADAHIVAHCQFGDVDATCPVRADLPDGYVLYVSSCKNDYPLTYCDPFAFGTAHIVIAADDGTWDHYWIDYAAGQHAFTWAGAQTVLHGPVELRAWIEDFSPSPGLPSVAGHQGTLQTWLAAPN